MIHRTGSVALTVWVVTLGSWLGAAPASAWDDAPLCAYPTSDSSGPAWTEPEWIAAPTQVPMCTPTAPTEPADEIIEAPDARASLAEARRLAAAGRTAEAILRLRITSEAYPSIADRLALEEAGWRMARGADEAACAAYARAEESPHRTVHLRARVGRARCLLTLADREGEELLDELLRFWPDLPQREELHHLLAEARLAWGETDDAIALHRRIDLLTPGSPWAARSRSALERIAASGVEVRPLTAPQRVERAERLVRSGPMDLAREEIAALRADEDLPRHLSQSVARSAARIARVEGRWADAHALLREAMGLPDLDEEESEALEARVEDLERAAESRVADDVRRRIRSITRGRTLDRQGTARLYAVLRIAARAQLADEVTDILEVIVERRTIPPGLRFEAAILGAGTGDDALVAQLFESASRHPSFGMAARYHRARALERLGRLDEARAEYAAIVTEDSERLPYYAMWSRQRLRETGHVDTPTPRELAALPSIGISCTSGPYSPALGKTGGLEGARDVSCTLPMPSNPYSEEPAEDDAATPRGEDSEPLPDPLAEADEAAAALERAEAEARPNIALSDAEILEQLGPVAEAHGETFPWLARAMDLVRLGETDAAADELHETYITWREATGGGSLRASLAGVMRGGSPPRHRVAMDTWRGRRRFPAAPRETLALVCAALGDHGLAIRFGGGFGVSGPRPRAYADIVEAAAARHGVEPELLFAVMRVESVYNPRIISYAGAVGLMQIMPRTGTLIARARRQDDFTVDQLLEPEINIDMAAWYLASLIERFEGRLPLAIASYNGGPHNVRRWMRDHSPDMPLDAFLERIPFAQTHRYVRRVMTHYEAYKAQRGERLAAVDVRLPDLDPDTVAF
ncbi:MAG: hypothetical protein SangKO_093670 [Sandaracinaceae bacterium]